MQDYFSHIHLKNKAIALCLDSVDADLQILKHYRDRGIKNYRTFVANAPPPFMGISANLRVAVIYFTEVQEEKSDSLDKYKEVFAQVKQRNPNVTEAEFSTLLGEDERSLFKIADQRKAHLGF